MRKIFVAWEFGGGRGHLTAVCALAQLLVGRGAAVVLAVPDPAAARAELARRGAETDRIRCVQGLRWRARRDLGRDPRDMPTLTLADAMALFGWDEAERIGPRAKFWWDLVAAEAPDVVVGDFAPTLRLASAGVVPMAMVGTGYAIPPFGRVLPPLRPWQSDVPAYSRRSEGAIMAAANRVRRALSLGAVDHVADLFHGDVSLPCTAPQFDPYARWRSTPTLPPHNVEPVALGPPLAEREWRALVHLPSASPGLRHAVEALRRMDFTVDLVVRGSPADLPADLPAGVAVHAAPLDLAAALPRVRLAVHHGGLGLAYAAALAATPQIMLSERLEHQITAQALVDRGAATAYDGVTTMRDFQGDVACLTKNGGDDAARALAIDLPRRCGEQVLHQIADRIHALVPAR
jgi:UDP:flavonoid glycosyltransferase YjiC (YdhE family)